MDLDRITAGHGYKNIVVGWSAPPANWIKLNFDGCSKGNPGNAGGGGLFRNSFGDWISGFVVNIGSCTAAEAELWAVLFGLVIAQDRGFQSLILEVDSPLVVQWLTSTNSYEGQYLVQACHRLMRKIRCLQVKHVYREGNKAADWLSALQYGRGVTDLQSPPVGIIQLKRMFKVFVGAEGCLFEVLFLGFSLPVIGRKSWSLSF